MADLDIVRRAVACRGWRWMPGMRDQHGRRIAWTQTYPGGIYDGDARVRPDNGPIRHDSVPDLTDPATLGCLLALVREAWAGALVCVYPAHNGHRWEVEIEAPGEAQSRSFYGDTEAEALILALEAADAR